VRLNAGRRALRNSAAVLNPVHVALVEVRGAGAREALDRMLPCSLHLADGQARPTLLLDDDGSVIADVTVARLERRYLVFFDGCPAHEAIDRIRTSGSGVEFDARDARDEGTLVSVHGPYAWELVGAWLGHSVAGIPPLALLRGRGFVVLRSGRTGEYGYDVFLTGAGRSSALDRLRDAATPFDAVEASLDAFDACVLEAGGFVSRWLARDRLSPFELQLQWRIDRKKDHGARTALDGRRASSQSRIAWFTSTSAQPPGGNLSLEGTPVGSTLEVIPAREVGFAGVALLERAVSHPGFVFDCDGGVRVTTASPPLVMPASQRVRPQTDSYATRPRNEQLEPR
jgi:aminomethyltransferase